MYQGKFVLKFLLSLILIQFNAQAITLECGSSDTQTIGSLSANGKASYPYSDSEQSGYDQGVASAKSDCMQKLKAKAGASYGKVSCSSSSCWFGRSCKPNALSYDTSGATSSGSCLIGPVPTPTPSSSPTPTPTPTYTGPGANLAVALSFPFLLFRGSSHGPQQWNCTASCSGSVKVTGGCGDCEWGCDDKKSDPIACEIPQAEIDILVSEVMKGE